MASAKLLKKVYAICELNNTLENIAADDRTKMEDMTDAQIIKEAEYVLSLFLEGGTVQSEMLDDDDPEVRKDGRGQIRKLRTLIKSYNV